MKCQLCGCEFDGNAASSSCEGCMMSKKCRLVRCPNCGYEAPKIPDWIVRAGEKISAFCRRFGKRGRMCNARNMEEPNDKQQG